MWSSGSLRDMMGWYDEWKERSYRRGTARLLCVAEWNVVRYGAQHTSSASGTQMVMMMKVDLS